MVAKEKKVAMHNRRGISEGTEWIFYLLKKDSKTYTYTHPQITKPTRTHPHTLQNPHILTLTYYKTS